MDGWHHQGEELLSWGNNLRGMRRIKRIKRKGRPYWQRYLLLKRLCHLGDHRPVEVEEGEWYNRKSPFRRILKTDMWGLAGQVWDKDSHLQPQTNSSHWNILNQDISDVAELTFCRCICNQSIVASIPTFYICCHLHLHRIIPVRKEQPWCLHFYCHAVDRRRPPRRNCTSSFQ